jgi:hypothetical protein
MARNFIRGGFMQERLSKMSFKRLRIAVAVLCGFLLVTAGAHAFFYANICLVTGTIQIQGHSAVKGLPIAAYIGDAKVSESRTGDNGSFELRIPEYDSSKPEVNGYHSINDIVQVKLDGKNARPTFNPNSDNLKIDLRVETSLDIKLSTWGKIKALFK